MQLSLEKTPAPSGSGYHHYNQALLLEVRQPLEAALLRQAVLHLLRHHDALRLRFRRRAGGWQQENAPPDGSVPFSIEDLSGLSEAAQGPAIEARAAALQHKLDLANGPLMRVAYFDLGANRPGRLLLAVHHLAIDGVSWRILLDDLLTVYTQLTHGQAPQLPPKTTSFQQWAKFLEDYARSDQVGAEAPYWLAEARTRVQPLPVDFTHGPNTYASVRTVTVTLGEEQTQALLHEVPEAYRTQINDVLLCALGQTLAFSTGQPLALVDLEGHGREEHLTDADLSRTVGWFTTIYPVLLEIDPRLGPGEALKSVKEQLRAVPNGGIGYGLLRYLRGDAALAEHLRALPRAEILFNYLGQLDRVLPESAPLARAPESAGPTHFPQGTRSHLLTVNGSVLEGTLRLNWSYSETRHRPETVERLAQRFLKALRGLIVHCLSPDAGGYTPSDFPLAGLDQAALDRLLGKGRDIEDVYPLSPMQQGMLFHALYAPRSGTYVEQLSCTLEGHVDGALFERAWQQVIDRQPVLRTSFHWSDLERPLQVVHRRASLPLEKLDWRGVSPAEQDARLQVLLQNDREQGLELTQAPLMRLKLIRLADQLFQVVWVHHHLLMDGWSVHLVLKEVFGLYAAQERGREIALPPALPFCDFIAWLGRQDLAKAEAFWRQTLKGFTSLTRLAVGRAAESRADQPAQYLERKVNLSEELSNALRELARQHRLTLNTLMQGAWALLLSRYSGQDDVVFGATTAGRPADLPGTESRVGLFINTLPVRARVASDTPFLAWLGELQNQQAELRQYEFSPLAQVQRWSEIPRGERLFETLFVFENYPVDSAFRDQAEDDGLKVIKARPVERTNYPLTLTVGTGTELGLRFLFEGNRFDSDTVARMHGHLQTLLEGIVANPEQPLAQMPWLTVTERRQVLTEWNDTATIYRQPHVLHQLLEAQVARSPEAVALDFEGQQLTYGELNGRANQLAHYLRSLGVGPDTLVGLCAERSLEMVVALWGILKAGGAYLPFDPEYPKDRLAFMLDDSQVPVLLTQEHLLERLPSHGAQVLCLDSGWAEVTVRPADNLACTVTPDNLAYVIYTSGSTGRPKGSLITHRGICNRLLWMQDAYELTDADRVLQKTPYSFDVSVWEFFWPLLAGAWLVIARPGGHRDSAYLVRLIAAQQITVLHFVPSMLQVFLEEQGLEHCGSLRDVMCSGEALPWELQKRFFARLAASLHNLYGPTEASVDVTYWPCPRRSDLGLVPIGYPIANTQIYILDGHGQPVPVGVPGELHIGGVGLARGYLNRPELTAEKFICDPYGPPGARLYKTGDLARWRPDGSIEYLGRLDFQVKIRGFRIELGEIEATLDQHLGVRQSVVVARSEEGGGKRLVAYVVARGAPPSVTDLRAHLGQKLPEYMVPAAFVFLEALPLTSSGKVDRRALPAPEGARPELTEAYMAPRTPAEQALAQIWTEVLRLERVGIHDNFFELGGDSILSIQIVARANQAGLRLTPKHLFQHQTIAGLAGAASSTRAVAAEQGPVTGSAPLTPIQCWFFNQDLPEPHHYNQALLLEVRPPLTTELLGRALPHLLEHHDALRLRFERTASGWKQNHAPPGGTVPFAVVDLSALPEADQGAALAARATELQAGGDLAAGSLLRAAYFELGPGRPGRLLLVAHHLAVDGLSWRILLEDLLSLCHQLSQGQSPRLPPKTTSFKEWATFLAAHARSGTAEAETAFWLAEARGQASRLPVDIPAGLNTEASGQTVEVSLEVDETEALLRRVPEAYHTQINDVLLTALAQTLAPWTGTEQVLVDLEGHGREDQLAGLDLSRTVGWFTSIVPVLLDANDGRNPGEAIKRTKEQLRAIPNGGLGYGLLRYLRGDVALTERLCAPPQAEVLFNYLGQLDRSLPEGAPVSLVRGGRGPSHSPLARRSHLLTVNGSVVDRRLRVSWGYSENVHHHATMEELAARYVGALRALIDHCLSADAGGYTPSDFPAADLSQDSLDQLLSQINSTSESDDS